MVDAKEFLRKTMPSGLWRMARRWWYGLGAFRFYRDYIDGARFSLAGGIYRTSGFEFEFPDKLVKLPHRARFFRDTHERDERILVQKYFSADATVLELGAGLGIVSCFINRMLSDGARHVAVEANPALIDTIKRNRDRNDCRFDIQNCLVSRNSDGRFWVDTCVFISSGETREAQEIQVPVKSVDDLEHKSALRFDSLFMDIQGGEYQFFTENSGLVANCKAIVLELHPHLIGEEKCEACRAIMREAGLRCVERLGVSEAWVRAA